jgi:hypothetical protein
MDRQGSEMTNVPDPNPHASHDLELIAAHAAGDAEGAERERAAALMDACDECARLHADLLVISSAMAALPAPARPRDFRLTEEQAAKLRPSGWRGALASLAAPRFSFIAPLGTAMATLGLVGVLIAGPGLPILGSSSTMNVAEAPALDQAMPESAAGAAAPSPAPGAASPATGAEMAPVSPGPVASSGIAAGGGYSAATPGADGAAPGSGSGTDTANGAPATAAPTTGAERNVTKTDILESPSSVDAWLMAGAVLLLVAGVILVGLRLVARRAR